MEKVWKKKQKREVTSRELCFICDDCKCEIKIVDGATKTETRNQTISETKFTNMAIFMHRYKRWGRCQRPWNRNIDAEGSLK